MSALAMAAQPPMYTIVSSWDVPRRLADTTALMAYGTDATLLHQTEGSGYAVWWAGTSMAAVLKPLDELHTSSAAKHVDHIYVSQFYNWRSGSVHGAYTQATSFKLKPNAPDDAVAVLSKNIFVPLFERLLADGTLIEYRVDVEAEHTESPDTFWITVVTANAEGLDKVNTAIAELFASNPLVGPTFGSAVDFGAHRDYLYRTEATFQPFRR